MREREFEIHERNEPAASTFAALVDAHLLSAYRLASVLLGNETDAEDAVQDAATAAWGSFRSLRDARSFDGWFDRILVNKCRDRLRRKGRVRFIRMGDAPEPTTSDRSARVAERDAVATALDELPLQQREVIVLRYFQDLSIDEIAAVTGERAGTVKSRLHYGLATLRAAFDATRRAEEARP